MNEEREKLKSKSREVPLFVSPKWRKRERKRERERVLERNNGGNSVSVGEGRRVGPRFRGA